MVIDLHGLIESEVYLELDAFLWSFAESSDHSATIITGQGIVIRDVVIEHLEKEGIVWEFQSGNRGVLEITK